MLEIVRGGISVDGIDLSTLNVKVCSRIDVVSDEDIIQALHRVRLWSIVDEQGGIDEEIDLSYWSAG
ncbi:hypothetical protein M441DRAFT_61982 [Trichoderma asperellum CBS 433.97]|uniref:Uncharacterized protein n=1 Tax=Trichoderma asperellum (strain ATCC 204424 / CBS 433.97 / NBRC 101777) TaxID=1042311 RepID=A0A2T3YVB7_TRIA4|nr:hypothetical protein M441DRAFT_61982 [Trichoderma asperellum CBS 433.97]PTB36513.1 hypothetical protein M441DRAFT_61982 [Trichoderma asperellum CBS 433.97]